MSDAKHTPAPWRVKHGTNIFGPRADVGHDGVVANCGGHAHSHVDCHHESEANARLIAASPDLLAACEALLALVAEAVMHGMPVRADVAEARNVAVAAIAKAKGEPTLAPDPATLLAPDLGGESGTEGS